MPQRGWPFQPGRQIEITKAEGAYLYTQKGDKLLDAAGGAVVVNIGHGRKRVAEAVYEATKEQTYVVPPWLTPSRSALLESLDAWLPDSLTRVHLTSGGSEANESALKLAIQYHAAKGEEKRTKVLCRDLSYHGTTLTTTAISGHANRRAGLENALTAFPTVETPYPLRCPLGPHHADAGAYYLEALKATIEREGPETIAAFIAEPITGSSGGAIVPPDEYWPGVRDLCDEYGILLIVDEVMTGFGRTGIDFGYQHWEIEPDILVGGKGLAGGYAPLGGMFASEAVGSVIENSDYQVMFNTFGAHPAACAAATEVLDIIREESLVERVQNLGALLRDQLHARFHNHPYVAEYRGRGLLQAIEIVRDRESLERFPREDAITQTIVGHALKNGVFFYGGGTGPVRDIVCIGAPFITTEAEIAKIVEVLADAVDSATS